MVINFRTQIALRYADFGEMPCVYNARAKGTKGQIDIVSLIE